MSTRGGQSPSGMGATGRSRELAPQVRAQQERIRAQSRAARTQIAALVAAEDAWLASHGRGNEWERHLAQRDLLRIHYDEAGARLAAVEATLGIPPAERTRIAQLGDVPPAKGEARQSATASKSSQPKPAAKSVKDADRALRAWQEAESRRKTEALLAQQRAEQAARRAERGITFHGNTAHDERGRFRSPTEE